jgi:hypothetical protein
MKRDKLPFKTNRGVLYVKDISTITGRKYRTAWNLYQEILRTFNKDPGHYLTVQEFCLYTGINEEVVREYLT